MPTANATSALRDWLALASPGAANALITAARWALAELGNLNVCSIFFGLLRDCGPLVSTWARENFQYRLNERVGLFVLYIDEYFFGRK